MVENGGRENGFDRLRTRFEKALRDLATETLGKELTNEEMVTFKQKAEDNFPYYRENGRLFPGTEWHSIQGQAARRTYTKEPRRTSRE